MRNYYTPEVEIISLIDEDIIRTSNAEVGANKGENQMTDIFNDNSWTIGG